MTNADRLPLETHWVGDTLEITWDGSHPLALSLGINDWSERQWAGALLSHSREILGEQPEP